MPTTRQEREWAEARGLRRVQGAQCIRRLTGEAHDAIACDCHQPWADHGRLYETADGRLAFVSQPYASIDDPGLVPAYEYATRHGLELEVSRDSWWMPGHTVALILSAGGLDGVV